MCFLFTLTVFGFPTRPFLAVIERFSILFASDAKNAKEGLSAKGYSVDYANEQRAENGSEDGGRGHRNEFRSRNSPRKSNQTGSDHGVIDFAEADSTDDNR